MRLPTNNATVFILNLLGRRFLPPGRGSGAGTTAVLGDGSLSRGSGHRLFRLFSPLRCR